MLNSYVYIITLFLYTIRFIITSQKYKINDFLQIISSIFYQQAYFRLTNTSTVVFRTHTLRCLIIGIQQRLTLRVSLSILVGVGLLQIYKNLHWVVVGVHMHTAMLSR